MDLSKARELFHLDDEITYLNCANMSPMLKSARMAAMAALETRSMPWKLTAAGWFEDGEKLRNLAAAIYQTSEDNIALVSSASYGLAVAARNLKIPKGKNIILLDNQFPSNYYVWEEMARKNGLQLIVVKRKQDTSWTECLLEQVNENTGLITIPNCHWIEGNMLDLEKISAAAKSVKAYLVLDLSQSLGALPIDIEKIDPDFAVSVGYKWLLGPLAMSYLYVSPKHHDGEPLEYSWITRKGSDDFTALTSYNPEYRTGARRYDMGEYPQFQTMPSAIAGLQQVIDWGVSSIQTQLKQLTDMVVDFKRQTQLLEKNAISAGHLVSIPLMEKNATEVKNKLDEKKIVVSFRSSASIRVSPHLYNSAEEIDNLLSCLQ